MKKHHYKWQNTTIWIVSILTFISININSAEKEIRGIGYILDLVIGIGLNIIILL